MSHPEDRSLATWTLMFWNRHQRLLRLKAMNAPDVLIAREEALIQEARAGMARVRDR